MGSPLRLLSCLILVLPLSMIVIPQALVQAGDLDGTSPAICAFKSAVSCDSDVGCEPTRLDELNMPNFFNVDFKNRKLTAMGIVDEGVKKQTPIKSCDRQDGKLLLQGYEIRAGAWSLRKKQAKCLSLHRAMMRALCSSVSVYLSRINRSKGERDATTSKENLCCRNSGSDRVYNGAFGAGTG